MSADGAAAGNLHQAFFGEWGWEVGTWMCSFTRVEAWFTEFSGGVEALVHAVEELPGVMHSLL